MTQEDNTGDYRRQDLISRIANGPIVWESGLKVPFQTIRRIFLFFNGKDTDHDHELLSAVLGPILKAAFLS